MRRRGDANLLLDAMRRPLALQELVGNANKPHDRLAIRSGGLRFHALLPAAHDAAGDVLCGGVSVTAQPGSPSRADPRDELFQFAARAGPRGFEEAAALFVEP